RDAGVGRVPLGVDTDVHDARDAGVRLEVLPEDLLVVEACVVGADDDPEAGHGRSPHSKFRWRTARSWKLSPLRAVTSSSSRSSTRPVACSKRLPIGCTEGTRSPRPRY